VQASLSQQAVRELGERIAGASEMVESKQQLSRELLE